MSLLRRSIHVAGKQVYYLAILSAVLLLSAIGTTVWLTSAVEQRKDEVAAWASKQLGYPVSIGSTDLYWLDLVPKLHVRDMKIMQHDNSESLLALEHIYLGIDLLASFERQQAVLENISLTGLEVGVTRSSSGQFQLTGMANELSTSSKGSTDLSSWLALLEQFDLNEISIHYQDFLNEKLSGRYQLENAVISHSGEQWASTAQINLPEQLGKTIAISGEFGFDIEQLQLMMWQLQLKADDVVLEPLLIQQNLYGLQVQDGRVTMHVDAHGLGNKVSQLNSEVLLQNIQLNSAVADSIEPVNINQLSGDFAWKKGTIGWDFSGENLLIDINQQQWPKTNFTINKNFEEIVTADVDYLRLSDLSAIALLTDVLPDDLRNQKPAGDVTALHLVHTPQHGINSLAMSLNEFAVLPWRDIPGITGLTATVDWHNGIATVDLDSHQLSLYPEKWLDDAVYFDYASGQLRWQQDLNWQLVASDFQLWNDDFTIQLEGSFEHDNGITQSDLNIKIEQLNVSRWQQYVPQSMLDVDFKEWSDNAFVVGTVVDGEITLKGNLAAFPFEEQPEQGMFDMNLNMAGVQLHYAPGWPDLINLTGTINGHNNLLKIDTETGVISGFNLGKVETKISKYLKGKPILTVEGPLNGTTQHALDFLQTSPLQQRFGKAAESLIAEGKSDIQLALMVPLANPDNTLASGIVSFNNSKLSSTEFDNLTLAQVNGHLQFNNDGVSAESITAKFLEQDVNVNVKPLAAETLIILEGNVSTEDVTKFLEKSVPSYISGHTDYQVELKVYEKQLGEFELDATLTSDLIGLAIDLPEPLGKKYDDIAPIHLAVKHFDEALAYTASYGEKINAIMMPEKNDSWRGELRFGQGQAVLPDSGVAVKGQLQQVSIDDWLTWQQSQTATSGKSLVNYIDVISMNIDRLDAYQQSVTQLAFSAERAAQDWRISLHSDQVKGNVILPLDFSSDTPVTMDFDYLKLVSPKQTKASEEINVVVEKVTTLWPSINFHTDYLQFDQMKFGEINMQANKHESSWVVNSAILKSDTINASINGEWKLLPAGSQSHFTLNASSEDVQGLFADLDYQQVIDAENIDIRMDLTWAGSPIGFSRGKSIGQSSIDIGKGRLIDIEPGAAGRIFGLLSVTSIPRRLSLDFTDLFGKGFSFDAINGSFGIENGTAHTEDLTMKGQPATIEVIGSVHLVEQTYDQKIKITPNVSSSLPIAGAVAGGPVGLGVGTAILIFDKLAGQLFDKQIVNLISYSYSLTGPWDEPELNTINASTN